LGHTGPYTIFNATKPDAILLARKFILVAPHMHARLLLVQDILVSSFGAQLFGLYLYFTEKACSPEEKPPHTPKIITEPGHLCA